ncbi:MAG: thiamine-phosphate kinase [Gemmatimonadota bacterium]|nr:thiamine-phosphate kinase [Gemmatimonadota bacterium]
MNTSRSPRLGPGGEFRRIEAILAAADAPPGDLATVGPGDDAAVLAPFTGRLVVSSDLTVEDVHFRRGWMSWEELGWRATAAALSDLAAMGAAAVGALLSLALGPEEDETVVEALARGAGRCLRETGGALLGGDLTASPGPLVLDVIVLGRTERPLTRAGARPGDEVWVTGRLGGAAAAVEAWRAGQRPDAAARRAFVGPSPRLREAAWLADRADIRAAVDLSDGVAGDAGHVAAASAVRLRLDGTALPVHPAAAAGRSPAAARRMAAAGGEDYELLLVAAPGALPEVGAAFRAEFDVPLTRIGTVETGEGVTWDDPAGRSTLDGGAGFDHFPGGPGGVEG